jgi:pimeloyl-ACP methyl ester carboxylesterase
MTAVKALITTAVLFALGILFAILPTIKFIWSVIKTFGMVLKARPREEPPEAKDPKYGKHTHISANGINFHCVTSGPADGELMLFLHGFPQNWYTWRHIIPKFNDRYKVVAVDMRGYGESSKPDGVEEYGGDKLAADVRELVGALGSEKCILVAHDWGGAVAYRVAHMYPETSSKVVVLNAPHPGCVRKNMTFKQLLKSWYIFFFQIPFLPELIIKSNDFGWLVMSLLGKKMGVRDRRHITKEDIEVFKFYISKPKALTSAINYYRAAFATMPPASKTIPCPTLLIWGEEDAALGKELNRGLKRFIPNLTEKYLPGVSHWVPEEKPEEAARLISDFLDK